MSAGRGAETFHDKTKRGDAEGAETRAEIFHDKKSGKASGGPMPGQVNIKVPIFVTRNHE